MIVFFEVKKSEQKYIRISPRKIRLVVKAIKGLSPIQALEYLKFLNKRSAKPLAKTIKQAIANGVNNQKVKEEDLRFSKIEIMEGPTYKRWQPVSRGRVHSIFKRTSHIRVVLESTTPEARSTKSEARNKSKLSKSE